MKRIAILLAAIMMLTAAALPVCASADSVVFSLDAPASANVGDTVTVRLNVSGADYEAHTLRVEIHFDTRSLEFVEARNGEALTDPILNDMGMAMNGLAESGDFVSFGIMMPLDPLTAHGEFLTMTFRVLSTADATAELTVEVPEFGYLPVGELTSTPITNTECSGANISISGGVGQDTPDNTIPPVDGTATPDVTQGPDAPISDDPDTSDAPDDGSDPDDPDASDAPDDGSDPDDPDASDAPDDGSDPDSDSKGLSTAQIILIVAGCVVLAGGVVAITLIVKRCNRK